jgi:hypothetical protein
MARLSLAALGRQKTAKYGLKSSRLVGRALALMRVGGALTVPLTQGAFMTNRSYSRNLISVAALTMVIGAGSSAMAQQRRGDDHSRGVGGRVFSPSQVITPRGIVSRPYAPPVYRTFSPAPRVFSPRPFVNLNIAPTRFNRPYYAFRPRVNIGRAFSIGFPVAYSYGNFYDPYNYSPYNYSAYGNPYPVNTGGASFEIAPGTAEVLVDGIPIGPANQFTPMTAPMGLAPGYHHFEIRAPGYQTIAFDADILAGQVTPFQGTMAW